MTEVVLEKVRQNVGYRERDSSVPGIIRWASRFLSALQQRFIGKAMLFRVLTSVSTRGAKVRFYLIPKLQLPPFR
jgi:hypothetical protein